MSQHDNENDGVVVIDREDEELAIKPPSRYDVVLLNDDFTPMDWVVFLLMEVFTKSEDEAGRIMLLVHTTGEGVAKSNVSRDIADTLVTQTINLSQANGHPLKAGAKAV